MAGFSAGPMDAAKPLDDPATPDQFRVRVRPIDFDTGPQVPGQDPGLLQVQFLVVLPPSGSSGSNGGHHDRAVRRLVRVPRVGEGRQLKEAIRSNRWRDARAQKPHRGVRGTRAGRCGRAGLGGRHAGGGQRLGQGTEGEGLGVAGERKSRMGKGMARHRRGWFLRSHPVMGRVQEQPGGKAGHASGGHAFAGLQACHFACTGVAAFFDGCGFGNRRRTRGHGRKAKAGQQGQNHRGHSARAGNEAVSLMHDLIHRGSPSRRRGRAGNSALRMTVMNHN